MEPRRRPLVIGRYGQWCSSTTTALPDTMPPWSHGSIAPGRGSWDHCLQTEERGVSMAVVSEFKRVPKERLGVHPTSTVCEYIEFEAHGERILQLSSGGSKDRQNPGKVSQT